MAESKKDTRQKAAEARAAAEAAERRRERTVRIVGGLAVLLVVIGILAVGVLNSNNGSAPAADANSARPAGVGEDYGVVINPDSTAPPLEIYEDFQCPACAALERTYGTTIVKAAANDSVQLVYRPMTFLDANLGNDASLRATAAWGCAIDAGKTQEYHSAVFANQPANEGDGYTDELLKQIGADVGIQGADLETFTGCVDAATYQGWAQLSQDAASERGVSGTPTIFLDGDELPRDALASEEALQEAIASASQQ